MILTLEGSVGFYLEILLKWFQSFMYWSLQEKVLYLSVYLFLYKSISLLCECCYARVCRYLISGRFTHHSPVDEFSYQIHCMAGWPVPGKSWKKKVVMESPGKRNFGKSPGKSLKGHCKIFFLFQLSSGS